MSDSFLVAASARCSDATQARAASYTPDDCAELLECARYGEDDDLDLMKVLLAKGVPVDHADDGGNTALHKASANGHVDIVRFLAGIGASHKPNSSGNYPLHWAVQQGQVGAAKVLLELFADVDVLAKNSFGRSVNTEAFEKGDAQLVELVLQHPSAKRLEPEGEGEDAEGEDAEVTHSFVFEKGLPAVQLRELAHLGSDETQRVLGATPDDDKTGLQLWAASLVLCHWLLDMRERLKGRPMIELGAGCGLCGIVAVKLCGAGPTLVTDLAQRTVENMRHNIEINDLSVAQVRAAALDWRTPSKWPAARDVVIGADLVYASEAVPHLLRVVRALVAPGGCFLYVAPETNRQGEPEFLQGMVDGGFACQVSAVPDVYLRSVLPDHSEDDFRILFAELTERTYSLCATAARPPSHLPPTHAAACTHPPSAPAACTRRALASAAPPRVRDRSLIRLIRRYCFTAPAVK